ncbi:MAG: prepilin peptidase [Sphingopyxis sp.]|nr:prepilin peptidase [Sphingopyxis sp.]
MAWTLIFGLLLVTILLTISVFDIREMRIPDALNFLLLICGISFRIGTEDPQLLRQIAFAGSATLVFYAVRQSHARVSGRIGLGLGDVKMVGAASIWISPLLFPFFVFTATISALVYAGLYALQVKGRLSTMRIPFGPFLSFGLLCAWLTEVTA